MQLSPKTCDIPDLESGELCERPLYRSRGGDWPFCFEHRDEWSDHSTRRQEMRQKPLEPDEWARWRKTGEARQGGLKL